MRSAALFEGAHARTRLEGSRCNTWQGERQRRSHTVVTKLASCADALSSSHDDSSNRCVTSSERLRRRLWLNQIFQNQVSERRLRPSFCVAWWTRLEPIPTFVTDMKGDRITYISIKFSASYMLLVAFCLLYSTTMLWKWLSLLSDTWFWSIQVSHHRSHILQRDGQLN